MTERIDGQQRLTRVLSVMRELTPNTTIPIAELSERTGLSPQTLAKELTVLSLCSGDPRDPLSFIPVLVDGASVDVFGQMPALERPIRLTYAEVAALIAALEIAGVPPADPLFATLTSASSPNAPIEDVERMVMASSAASPDFAEVLRRVSLGIESSRVLELEYQGAGSDVPQKRAVEPVGTLRDRDTWYLRAWCRNAEAERTFRFDRICDIRVTGELFALRSVTPVDSPLTTEGLPVARLRLAPGLELAAAEWPGLQVLTQNADGSSLAEVPFAGHAWLARQVVAHLGAIEVLGPSEVREAVTDLADDLLGG